MCFVTALVTHTNGGLVTVFFCFLFLPRQTTFFPEHSSNPSNISHVSFDMNMFFCQPECSADQVCSTLRSSRNMWKRVVLYSTPMNIYIYIRWMYDLYLFVLMLGSII